MQLYIRLSLLLMLSFLTTSACTLSGQASTILSTPADSKDARAFRTLFNRDRLLIELADAAEAAGAPKPYLRKQLAMRLSLNEPDSITFHRLALAYQSEIDPVHAKVVAIVVQFHARFPDGVIRSNVDAAIPRELQELQRTEDLITLRYRDLLHNSMSEGAFQAFQSKVRAKF